MKSETIKEMLPSLKLVATEGILEIFDISTGKKRLELDCLPASVRAESLHLDADR